MLVYIRNYLKKPPFNPVEANSVKSSQQHENTLVSWQGRESKKSYHIQFEPSLGTNREGIKHSDVDQSRRFGLMSSE